jgi:hypothetical protein
VAVRDAGEHGAGHARLVAPSPSTGHAWYSRSDRAGRRVAPLTTEEVLSGRSDGSGRGCRLPSIEARRSMSAREKDEAAVGRDRTTSTGSARQSAGQQRGDEFRPNTTGT